MSGFALIPDVGDMAILELKLYFMGVLKSRTWRDEADLLPRVGFSLSHQTTNLKTCKRSDETTSSTRAAGLRYFIMGMSTFPFLELPPEIREKIYILVCSNSTIIPLELPDAHTSFPLNVLLTCHQLYAEIRPVYFSCNSFEITVRRHNDPWDYFLGKSWLDNRRAVRELHLKIIRWGSFNFFCDILVPALQDCILNGHLRTLCVSIRRSDFMTLKAIREGKPPTTDHQPLLALKELCQDPYLESVRLVTWSYGYIEAARVEPSSVQDVTWLLGVG